MKHCIVVKWNDKVSDKDLYFEKAAKAFEKVTDIAGVTGLKLYRSCSSRSNRYDLMIEITCSEEGLANYDPSPLHTAWKEDYGSFIESKAIFDYEE